MTTANTELVRVDPRYPGIWLTLSRYLQEALEKGGGTKDWSTNDMYHAIVEGHLALWALVTGGTVFGAAATCLTPYPRRQVLEVLAMGADDGYEDQWRECLETLGQHARAAGASAIVGTGRPGWARKLGAEERRVFELSLTDTET